MKSPLAAVRWMADVGCSDVQPAQSAFGDAPDGDDLIRSLPIQEELKHDQASAQLCP